MAGRWENGRSRRMGTLPVGRQWTSPPHGVRAGTWDPKPWPHFNRIAERGWCCYYTMPDKRLWLALTDSGHGALKAWCALRDFDNEVGAELNNLSYALGVGSNERPLFKSDTDAQSFLAQGKTADMNSDERVRCLLEIYKISLRYR